MQEQEFQLHAVHVILQTIMVLQEERHSIVDED
jgi:hypothetical protein